MVRNKNNSSKPANRTRIRSIYNQTATMNPSITAASLGTLTTSNSGMWHLNNQISSLSDMFRLFKVNGLTFEFFPVLTTGSTSTNVASGFLCISLQGQTDPANLSDVEGPLQSNLTLPYGVSTGSNTEALVRETCAKLTVRNKDLPILQGSSTPGDAGYLATQDDGTQTSYGKLFWIFASAATSAAVNYVLRTYFDLDFKDILDPSTISKVQAQRAADAVAYHCSLQSGGAGAHIEFSPGTLEKAIQLHIKVNRGVQVGRQSLGSAPSDVGDCADRCRLIQQLQEQLDALKE